MDRQEIPDPGELKSFISDGTSPEIFERYARLPELAETTDFEELDRNIVVLDTEATGFSYTHDELTQIAAARMECGVVTEWFVTFVNPGKPIPEDVVRLTDIHDEDVADAPSPDEALAALVEFVGDAKVVAHNVDFDRTFTTKHPSGYPLLENVWIDSLDLARIAVPRLKSHRLIDLVKAFGAPLSTHRADADVAATCAVFRILLAGVATMPPALVCRIADMETAGLWSTRVVFEYFAGAYRRAAADENAAHEPAGASGGDAEPAPGVDEPAAHEPAGAALPAAEGEDAAPDASTAKVPFSTRACGTTALDLEFSLVELRRGRTAGLEPRRKKLDADDIAADPKRTLRFPTADYIDRAFSREGTVGRIYPDFEPREEQLQMARSVADAFAASENLVVEAGTGVGKSMAYLVPAVATARENDVTVGVATKTNALLDQLVYHELPALADALADEDPDAPRLTFSPLKGFSHYICLRRVEAIVEEGPHTRTVSGSEVSQAPALAALLSYIEQSDYDDIDGLKMNFRALPRASVTTTSRDCLRRKCRFCNSCCFVHGARARAESADVVVTNHSLLFCDLVADGGLLPPIRYWVVDEAHGTEAEARRAFSVSIEAEDLLHLADRVDGSKPSRNVFARAERQAIGPIARAQEQDAERAALGAPGASGGAPDGEQRPAPGLAEGGQTLFYALMSKARSAGTVYGGLARDFAAGLKSLQYFDVNKRGRSYETVELWINEEVRRSAVFSEVAERGAAMSEAAEKLAHACVELVGFLEGVEGAAVSQRELASLAAELKDQINAIDVILVRPSEAYAYSATLCRRKDRAAEKLEALPVDVGQRLNETLFARTHAVVFASATLTVGERFDSFTDAVGLNSSEFSRGRTLKLDSSYDFDSQMTVYVVSDMPEPNAPGYLDALSRLLVDVHRAQGGSMLTLFTNRREMERCFEEVQPQLKADDLRLVCQKWGVSVKGLRDDFLKDESLSLFALKSFWEGFDAPGSTLRGVVIPKLPFSKPTDPLSCERAARDDQAWRRYVLPAAVLEVKQAAGRLIRKADDSGVVILADRRLLTKSYGSSFLRSMPSRDVRVLTAAQVAEELACARRR